MATFRRIYKIWLFWGWMLFIWVALALANFGSFWNAQRRIGKVSQLWGKGLVWIFGLKIKLVGDINHFKGGLLVSNHTGYIDIVVYAALLSLRFAPKSSIKKWPFIGWFVGTGRPIWIDRFAPRKSKLVARQFQETMDNNISVLVFPEGTSTSGVDGMLEFKSTPFEAVVDGNNWVLPAIIRYGETRDKEPVAWYGDMTLMLHLWRLLGYKEMQVEVTMLEPFKPEGRKRKELARFTYKTMEETYTEIFKNAIS